MNKAKEIFLKIKAAFDLPIAAPVAAPVAPIVAPVTATAQVFKLKDGSDVTITIDDPAVSAAPDAGDLVSIAGAPAPAGDYELEDGTKFTTDATGAITVITPIDPLTQPDFVAPVQTLEERIAAIEAKINSTQAQQPSPIGMSAEDAIILKAELVTAQAKLAKHDETITGLFELVEVLTQEPTALPVTLSGNKKEKFDKAESREKRFERMGKALTQLRNKSKNPAIQ